MERNGARMYMERRRQPRGEPLEKIAVSALDVGGACMPGYILDVSSQGLGLQLPRSLPPGTPIKVQTADAMILGEVSYCAVEKGGFRVGLAVKHRLAEVTQLTRLNHALLGAESVSPKGVSQLDRASFIMEE